eukprot:8463695-Alexandrium_andersonii.AAC.1
MRFAIQGSALAICDLSCRVYAGPVETATSQAGRVGIKMSKPGTFRACRSSDAAVLEFAVLVSPLSGNAE